MTVSLTCPSCGRATTLPALSQSAATFCENCDYPLFWAKPDEATEGPPDGTDASLRRLPGTGGRRTGAKELCRWCGEPNALDAKLCSRCGRSLQPEPEPEPEPEPAPAPPPPPPEPEPPRIEAVWPEWEDWVAMGIGALAILVVVLALLFG